MPRRGDRQRYRTAIAQEAARLMLRDGVTQYMDAKQIAARRVLGCVASHHGPRQHLPSNSEIRDALLALVQLSEGPLQQSRLFAMRVVALEVLTTLDAFHARLIGSVATGHARRGSDIDVHVFTDHAGALEAHLSMVGWTWHSETVSIRHSGQVTDFLHIHVEHSFAVELSVYPVIERRIRQRSSTDGKPIDRVSANRLRLRLSQEHAEDWADYQQRGVLDLDAFNDPMAGDFDALLHPSP